MDLRLVAVQIVRKALTAVGRGGSLPGRLALKMDSHFIEKFHMPKHVILVTGTNGKTTTSNLIAKSIMQAGLKVTLMQISMYKLMWLLLKLMS